MQRGANAHCQVFLPGDVGKLVYQCLVPCRSQPDWLRPLRKGAGHCAYGQVAGKRVARVGSDRDRDAQASALGQLLDPVVPLGRLSWCGYLWEVKVIHSALDQHLQNAGRAKPARPIQVHVVRVHGDKGMEHQPGLFLHGHL